MALIKHELSPRERGLLISSLMSAEYGLFQFSGFEKTGMDCSEVGQEIRNLHKKMRVGDILVTESRGEELVKLSPTLSEWETEWI